MIATRVLGRGASAVLGVDACRTGWVGAVLAGPDHRGRPTLLVAPTVRALVEAAERQVGTPPGIGVVAVDIPIGLPDAGRRQADVLARRALPGKGSSVFPTPVRAAVEAADYDAARVRSLARTGVSVSKQAWELRHKILDVDAYLRSRAPARVVEVHPEVSFARMAGAPVLNRKRTPQGAVDRRAVLRQHGVEVDAAMLGPERPRGCAVDDVLDACAAAWTGARVLRGGAESFPAEPEVFSDGLPAAIWV